MNSVERRGGTGVWNRGEESGEGLGAVVFLMLSFCIMLIVLVGVIVLSQRPSVVAPF